MTSSHAMMSPGPMAPALRTAYALAGARTADEVLAGLAWPGLDLGLDLWGLALTTERTAEASVCSHQPLDPGLTSEVLAHLVVSASNLRPPRPGCQPWSGAGGRATCLNPTGELACGPVAQWQDYCLELCDNTRAVLRAAQLGRSERPVAWEEVGLMVRAATPYLRAVCLQAPQQAALLDPASGVYGESYFLDTLDREIERARRHLGELSVAVLEVRPVDLSRELSEDNHQRIGSAMKQAVRRTDMVGRLGLRSYGAFFYNTGPRSALIAAGRIADALGADGELMRQLVFAVGVSGWEVVGPDPAGLLRQAREAATEALLISPGKAFVYV